MVLVSKKFQKVQDNVLKLYKEYPMVFKTNNMLISSYWYFIDCIRKVDQVKDATPADSITRAYRRLLASGKLKKE